MSAASLRVEADGRCALGGRLDFTSVPEIWPLLKRAVREHDVVTLSLNDVEQANSAGLVLLLEALDAARADGHSLTFSDVPGDVIELAKMSNCEGLIRATT